MTKQFLLHLGPQAAVGHPSIPYIRREYVAVKREFVKVCTAQGDPTLDEIKGYCIDLIEGAIGDMPQIGRHREEIKTSKTVDDLASVVCFHLSNWVSYDFFKAIITYFQPALKSVDEQLMHYKDQLKPLLQDKLKHIAKLQQRWVKETMLSVMLVLFLFLCMFKSWYVTVYYFIYVCSPVLVVIVLNIIQ